MRLPASLPALAFGAAAARGAYAALRRRPPGLPAAWVRTNHRGEQVSLLEGPACALAAAAGVAASPGVPPRLRLAGSLAPLGAGVLGGYDDLAGGGTARGFAGHLGALGRGEVTSGAVKVAGIAATGVGTAALLPRCRGSGAFGDTVVTGAAVAGSANLVNLFDLRPGRAIKVTLLTTAPMLLGGGWPAVIAAPPFGAAVALLPEDLGEASMLGDTGANALGAAVGVAAVSAMGPYGRRALLAALAGLTAASEVVSFTKVIDAVGPLRWVDRLGRAPRAAAARSNPAAARRPDG